MYKIRTLNNISDSCREILRSDEYIIGDNVSDPDAIFVRATDMHDYPFNPELLCIGRAGIGVNTIPYKECIEKGIAVFNTPGGNANGVKELFLFGLTMAGRDIFDAMKWVYTYDDSEGPVEERMEKIKKQFAGPEFAGKTLGVIGTGFKSIDIGVFEVLSDKAGARASTEEQHAQAKEYVRAYRYSVDVFGVGVERLTHGDDIDRTTGVTAGYHRRDRRELACVPEDREPANQGADERADRGNVPQEEQFSGFFKDSANVALEKKKRNR